MRGNENRSLIRRPTNSVEKTESGMNRILSGMVADTVALTKREPPRKSRPPRIVVVDDADGCLKMFKILIRDWFKDVTLLLFSNSSEAWQELLRTDPDLLLTRDRMPWLAGEEIVRRLVDKKVTYPIIVGGGWPPTEEWVREYTAKYPNITYLRYPFTVEQLYERLSKHLGPSDNPRR
jgi:DNA-binding NtrC family response regulator